MATKVKLIETGAVTGDIIPDGGIATGKLANDAVTTIKISDANITHAKLHTSMDLTGKTVTVATAAGSTNTTAAASTAFVQQELTTLIGGAPSTLDTLNELAAAINDDASYASTLTTALATKLPLAGGSLTGALNTTGRVNLTDDNSISEPYVQLGITNTVSSAGLFLHANSGSGRKYEIQSTAVGELIVYDRTSGAYRLKLLANGELTNAGNIDTAGLLKVGGNDTEYANNYLRFKPTGAAYIDHNTVGQAINFRLSNASSLDKTVMTLSSSGNALVGRTSSLSGQSGSVSANTVVSAHGPLSSHATNAGILEYYNDETILRSYGANAGSGKLVFKVGGGGGSSDSEAMRIESAGTVKISHADTASEGLRVIQTTAGRTSGGALGLFYDDQAGTTQPTLKVIQNGTGDILQLFDGGSQAVTVKDGGNVGIGTSSPNGTGFDGNATVLSVNGYYRGMIELGSNNNVIGDMIGGIEFRNTASTEAYVRTYRDSNGDSEMRLFAHHFNFTSGNVGIGTSSPQQLAHINGTGISYFRATGGTGNTGIDFGQHSNGNGYIWHRDSASVIIGTASTERMRIASDGSILIPNQNAINELTFTGTEFTNVLSATTSGFQFGTTGAGYLAFLTNNSEQMRLGAGASTGNMALGLINVAGANSEAAIHGQSNDSTLLLTNTDLSSNSTWGFTGRGARFLTSNGTTWTTDGKDAALVIGSNKATTQRGGGLGIVLHNESNVNGNYSPGIYFSTKSESSAYNSAYGYIMGAKTGRGGDTNWSTGEIHMDTAGSRSGSNNRDNYMDGDPAFKIDSAGDISMPYTSHAYGQWAGSANNSPTNNTGWAMNVLRSQNMTYQNNAAHGHGMTVTKAGMYVLGATGLYDPVTYVYIGWCINGSQQHHWHSNHTVESNHDYVSVVMRYLNIGDHVTFESSNIAISTYWGTQHSSWYMYKVG